MPSIVFTDAKTWYAGLPTMYGAAGALITDESGRVLLVKPNYRDHWSVPGGILEHGEPPHIGCARETKEEVGLDITPRQLLVLDWLAPGGDRPRPFVYFVFDGGTFPADTPITLQEEELDDYRFTAVADFPGYLPPALVTRYTTALTARTSGTAVYLPAKA
jgi:8-oxo-dGTP diphosphatase